MGINGLNKFLRNHCPSVFKNVKLKELQFTKAAVDFSLYVFKFKTVFGDNWINAMINFTGCLRKNNIHIVFVYDTSAPIEKQTEQLYRREQRDKLENKIFSLMASLEHAKLTGEIYDDLQSFYDSIIGSTGRGLLLRTRKTINLSIVEQELVKKQKQVVKITPEDISLSKHILTLLGVPWIDAPMEAETTCADFCKQNIVNLVFSEDTDVLCYGAPILITKINTFDESAVAVIYEEILECLEMTSHQFLDFCIMCGTDYNKNIPKIGPETAFKLLKHFGTIEEIGKSGIDITILNHVRIREIFKKYKRCNKKIRYCVPPDMQKLEEFLNSNGINISKSTIKNFGTHCDFVIVE